MGTEPNSFYSSVFILVKRANAVGSTTMSDVTLLVCSNAFDALVPKSNTMQNHLCMCVIFSLREEHYMNCMKVAWC